ncbi:response regulator [Lentibacillus cibarius]|uniref:Response regulator n=1 Tax=Lentibacillus cibarius TaxID=2583219 RepID=A0A549YFN4_9BACI|nr:response regulator [Lentibacillus cibarius]TMN21886.1 response regulator [Lentibacillus cibarius]TRM10693.1 response regulator [Lentibacillus cibarius]
MGTILIVDDSGFMRGYLKRMIQEHGYTDVIDAADGQEAINVYKYCNPAIVFLDITMPNVDGLTALEEIIKFNPDAKVVMCSAIGTESNVIKALQLGAIDFIVKPKFDGLIDVLNKHCHTY